MTILLLQAYSTYAKGATVDLDNATEAALVAQGRATYTVNPGTSFDPLTPTEQQNVREGLSLRKRLRSENTSYLRFGNSFDEGIGAGVVADGMANLVALARGFTLTNIAVGGQTLQNYVTSQYGSRVITAGDNISGTVGLNDLRYYGPLPANRVQFMQNLYASLSYLAIPDTNKVHAGINISGSTDYNPSVTYLPNRAAWSGTAEFKGTAAAGRALVTTTNGASVSASVTGDTVFIWYGQSYGTAGLIAPIIDGYTFSAGNVGTNPIADAPSSAGAWMLACVCVSGLSNSAHTVKITTGSTAPVVILAIAGIDSTSINGANVYAVGIPPLKPAHWNIAPGYNGSTQATADAKPIDFYELGAVTEWNAGIKETCEKLNSQGLNVNFVDVSGVSFQSIADGDLHPEPPQHWQYSKAELAVMASLRV